MQDAYIVEKRRPENPTWDWEPWFKTSSLEEARQSLEGCRILTPPGLFEYRISLLSVLEQGTI